MLDEEEIKEAEDIFRKWKIRMRKELAASPSSMTSTELELIKSGCNNLFEVDRRYNPDTYCFENFVIYEKDIKAIKAIIDGYLDVLSSRALTYEQIRDIVEARRGARFFSEFYIRGRMVKDPTFVGKFLEQLEKSGEAFLGNEGGYAHRNLAEISSLVCKNSVKKIVEERRATEDAKTCESEEQYTSVMTTILKMSKRILQRDTAEYPNARRGCELIFESIRGVYKKGYIDAQYANCNPTLYPDFLQAYNDLEDECAINYKKELGSKRPDVRHFEPRKKSAERD